MTARAADLAQFIAQAGWSAAERAPLAGDASNRRYERLCLPNGTRAVLMDAPPDKGEDVRPFVQIATYLTGLALSAPEIFAQDPARGFLLLEDLGDALFARVLETKPELETPLYEAATDALLHLHRAEPLALAPYDAATMAPLAALAFDWYQFGITGAVDEAAREQFLAAITPLLSRLDEQPRVLIQRDYHAENLLWLPDRTGVARVGLLDFQDAMLGHPAYDLVSVLQDARRDLQPETEARMIARFLAQTPQQDSSFREAYAILGAQRNLRILGVFARLCLRDGKAHYVDLIPRVWAHIETNLAHPALAPVAAILREALPKPTPDVLTALRTKCATCPDR
ncbi:aminoglycoside phosphotransferase family protein [Roseobacter sinensis]|uniref:Phosphotransferase n=1 Tax=Roseobacter sinensis TaxID=2931391 RepID=A0ABT3B8T3_9RHOB|nr:phosphotransferase [Roseobacter sp. WL0113]MCV3269992.1 phosphotransferase [Roseobacter sp. WL0113]